MCVVLYICAHQTHKTLIMTVIYQVPLKEASLQIHMLSKKVGLQGIAFLLFIAHDARLILF